jgi:hypothetical protein
MPWLLLDLPKIALNRNRKIVFPRDDRVFFTGFPLLRRNFLDDER